MEFQKVIQQRKSIRAYRSDPVPESAVSAIREAVQLAPTACNRQPFKVFFVTNPELRAKIAAAAPFFTKWLTQAPAIAVIAGNYEECWTRQEGDRIADVDCAIVMENLVLAAADQGLGTCWICAFPRADMDEVLGLSTPWRTFAVTPVGYPAENPERRSRKPAADLFEVR